MKEVHTINYYPINEGAARRAKEMNSFSDYKEGSATAEYRAMVDKAAAIAEKQKSRVDPMYHEKIDHLLDTYARKLAENMNQGFAIDARVPSVMIAGPANFPVGKKEKQNRARDSNMEEWRHIQGLLDKIRSTGMGGISADDPAAIEKLQKKLDGLERSQLIMKEVNAYYRKHGKLDGCALLSPDQIEKLKASMASSWRSDPRPFESYQLTNNNAEISRTTPSGRLTVWNVSSRCPAKSPPNFKRSPLSCRPCGNRAKKSRRSRKRKLRPAEMPSGKPRATLARGFLFPEIVRGPPG